MNEEPYKLVFSIKNYQKKAKLEAIGPKLTIQTHVHGQYIYKIFVKSSMNIQISIS